MGNCELHSLFQSNVFLPQAYYLRQDLYCFHMGLASNTQFCPPPPTELPQQFIKPKTWCFKSQHTIFIRPFLFRVIFLTSGQQKNQREDGTSRWKKCETLGAFAVSKSNERIFYWQCKHKTDMMEKSVSIKKICRKIIFLTQSSLNKQKTIFRFALDNPSFMSVDKTTTHQYMTIPFTKWGIIIRRKLNRISNFIFC